MSAAPSLSVILTCRNPGPKLPAALASVWEQHGVPLETIVVDRASTDGTPAWLAGEAARLATLSLAADTAVPEALNQGVARARGEWVYLFGPRDRLVGDRILSEVLNWMKKTEAGVVAGEAADDDGRIHKLRSGVNPLAGEFAPRAATFYRRTLFEENGGFDAEFATHAAYEFHLRLWKNRVRFKPIPLRIAACSPQEPLDWSAAREEIRARHRYFGTGRSLLWDAWSLLRGLKPGGRRADK
jgi:glycosyltransferase involved in cell wall biosynthesis